MKTHPFNSNQNPSSIEEALSLVKSSSKIFIHGASATPIPLVEGLANLKDVEDISTYHLHLNGAEKFGSESCKHIKPVSLFTGAVLRDRVNKGFADYVPIFLSDIPNQFYSKNIDLDVAIVQLSPPDRHGFCSLGTSIDAARAAVDTAKIIIAEINDQMPRTFGASSVHISKISKFIHTNRPLCEHKMKAPSNVENQIGNIVSELVADGATLQMGIGGIPDAVLSRLHNRQDLGIHTEMFSDGLVDLFNSGAITNSRKKVHPGRITTSFVTGTKKVFDFINDNPLVEFHPCDRTNDTSLIRKNDGVVAINSALQIDLSGQVCADSLGYSIYSGIGGQMDFIRGAALSKNGKPIIALSSTASGGKISRIVPCLNEGAGVVTTRGHVHYVITEFGMVNLHGKSLRQRAEMLIDIAHPDFRKELTDKINSVRHFHF
jgi:4-hydroxybutyrate CoA-transferase